MADPKIDSADSTDDRILGLFAKAWDAGAVKTRLAATVGNETAVELYKQLLTMNLQRFASSAYQRVVAYSPADENTKARFAEFMEQMTPAPQWDLIPQSDGGLGKRMSCFFEQQFAAHGSSSRVVLIGSDAVRLMSDVMEEAFDLLKSHDVVFGPSTDGGYYLVGLSGMSEHIFQDIDWSTEKVLEQSLAKCTTAGLSVGQLKPLTDVDTEVDLRQELAAIESADEEGLEVWLQKFLLRSKSILEGQS